MSNRISNKMVKAFERFNADLAAFLKDSDNSALYEDAYTTREVSDFVLHTNGTLSWIEDGRVEMEKLFDDDEAKEWLSFWKANLRRAKRYWSMETERLDAIQDPESGVEDNEE